jgi:hypothetical protein
MSTKEKAGPPAGTAEEGNYEKEDIKVAQPRSAVKIERLPNDHPLITRLLDLYVSDWKAGAPGDKFPRSWFYASDVGKCPRSIYYQFTAAEKKADMKASTIINFRLGNLFHEEGEDKFKRLGLSTGNWMTEFGSRVFAGIGFDRHGRIDVFVYEDILQGGEHKAHPDQFTPVVITEIKSKNPYGFQMEPEDYEIDQAMTYLADTMGSPFFAARRIRITDYALIFYIDRGGMSDPPFAFYRVDYSQERVDAITAEFRALVKAIDEKRTPARPYTRDSIPCGYCRFKTWCWRNMPAPEPPPIEPDPTVKVPDMEIVLSAAEGFLRLNGEVKKLEKEMELAEKIVRAYFKGTGQGELRVGDEGHGLRYIPTLENEIDVEYLLKKLKSKFHLVCKPQISLLKKAVKDGLIDGTTFETAVRQVPGEPHLKKF